jgi:spore maturation protein CgeB
MGSSRTSTPPAGLYSPERLQRNLAALRASDPELVERLHLPVAGDHVLFEPSGELLYVPHREPCRIALRGDEPELAGLGAERILLLGLGSGDLLDRALAEAGTREIVAWERDPWLLRLDLMRRDRSAELRSGRLAYRLGPDLLELRGWPGAVVPHPSLQSVYAQELASFGSPSGGRRALVCVGKLFVDQVCAELRSRGFELWSLDAARHAEQELDRTMHRFEPELVFAVNATNGLAEFCHRHGCKLIVWEVDPSLHDPPPCASPTEHVWIWTYRQANVEPYRRAGFAQVEHLPLAADPSVRAVRDSESAERVPISFVGNSMVTQVESYQRGFASLYASWRGSPGGAREALAILESILSEQRADLFRYRLAELLEERAPGFREAVLADPAGADPLLLAAEIAAAEKRLTLCANLASLDLHVWGDEGWKLLAPRGVCFQGRAGHGEELTGIYNRSRINLDIGRIYQSDIVTMRVFDVLCCGGFALVEHSAQLERCFRVGEELESYRSLAELRAKAAHYLEHPEEAAAIARRGHERVLREHTIGLRMQRMLEAAA